MESDHHVMVLVVNGEHVWLEFVLVIPRPIFLSAGLHSHLEMVYERPLVFDNNANYDMSGTARLPTDNLT